MENLQGQRELVIGSITLILVMSAMSSIIRMMMIVTFIECVLFQALC